MSPGGICWGTAPSFARMAPPIPPMRNLRPLRSATVLISFRYQPPICTPTLPTGNCTMLYFLNTSRMSCRPPPSYIHAACWRAFRPKGMPASKPRVGSLPKKNELSTWPHSIVPSCTALNTEPGGTISPAALVRISNLPPEIAVTRLAQFSADPCIASRLFGHMVANRQRTESLCAWAAVLIAPSGAASAAPAPACFRKSRLFMTCSSFGKLDADFEYARLAPHARPSDACEQGKRARAAPAAVVPPGLPDPPSPSDPLRPVPRGVQGLAAHSRAIRPPHGARH